MPCTYLGADPHQLVASGQMAKHLCPEFIWQQVPLRTTTGHHSTVCTLFSLRTVNCTVASFAVRRAGKCRCALQHLNSHLCCSQVRFSHASPIKNGAPCCGRRTTWANSAHDASGVCTGWLHSCAEGNSTTFYIHAQCSMVNSASRDRTCSYMTRFCALLRRDATRVNCSSAQPSTVARPCALSILPAQRQGASHGSYSSSLNI